MPGEDRRTRVVSPVLGTLPPVSVRLTNPGSDRERQTRPERSVGVRHTQSSTSDPWRVGGFDFAGVSPTVVHKEVDLFERDLGGGTFPMTGVLSSKISTTGRNPRATSTQAPQDQTKTEPSL